MSGKIKWEGAHAYNMWANYERNIQDKVEITYAKYKWTLNKLVSVIIKCTSGHEYNQMSVVTYMSIVMWMQSVTVYNKQFIIID